MNLYQSRSRHLRLARLDIFSTEAAAATAAVVVVVTAAAAAAAQVQRLPLSRIQLKVIPIVNVKDSNLTIHRDIRKYLTRRLILRRLQLEN